MIIGEIQRSNRPRNNPIETASEKVISKATRVVLVNLASDVNTG